MINQIEGKCYAFVTLSTTVLYANTKRIIGLKLDQEISKKSCRIAFYGDILETFEDIKPLDVLYNKNYK